MDRSQAALQAGRACISRRHYILGFLHSGHWLVSRTLHVSCVFGSSLYDACSQNIFAQDTLLALNVCRLRKGAGTHPSPTHCLVLDADLTSCHRLDTVDGVRLSKRMIASQGGIDHENDRGPWTAGCSVHLLHSAFLRTGCMLHFGIHVDFCLLKTTGVEISVIVLAW